MKFLILSLLPLTFAHIFMQSPPSRKNKYSEYYNSIGDVDYNLMAPLLFDGHSYTFPCKGYIKGPATQTYSGNTGTIGIQLEGSATHNGGHCQFGFSLDDSQFIVTHTVLENCLLEGLYFELLIPEDISGNVTLFWTWINRTGNREYYMECADIYIQKPHATSQQFYGHELVVANYPGYPTVEEGFPTSFGADLIKNAKPVSSGSGGGVPSPIQLPLVTGHPLPVQQPKSDSPTSEQPKSDSPTSEQPKSDSPTSACN